MEDIYKHSRQVKTRHIYPDEPILDATMLCWVLFGVPQVGASHA